MSKVNTNTNTVVMVKLNVKYFMKMGRVKSGHLKKEYLLGLRYLTKKAFLFLLILSSRVRKRIRTPNVSPNHYICSKITLFCPRAVPKLQ